MIRRTVTALFNKPVSLTLWNCACSGWKHVMLESMWETVNCGGYAV